MDCDKYLNIFNISVQDLEKITIAALKHGGDYSDLYFEYSTYNELLLKDGEVTSGGFHTDYGTGIRVLGGEKTGYAYSESTEMRDMLSAAETASLIAGRSGIPAGKCMRTSSARLTCRDRILPDLYHAEKEWRLSEAKEFLPFLKMLESKIMSKDPRVVKVIARLSCSQSDIMMYNSFSELVCDTRPMGSITASAIFSDGTKSENRTVSRSFRKGTEMICPEILEEISGEIVSGVDSLFDARRPQGGEMPVVMGAGASGILLHEAMGHAFEADFNRKGQSVFAGKKGRKICSESINIVDDGTLLWNRGACNFDDEGVPGQKTYMVKDGVLNSYLHDRISAKWYGTAPTGNGRRESFRFNPLPRMRATYMENGSASPEDIISSVRKGIYVDEFSNGQVKIGEGDFTFYVKSGRLIENGRLTMPVKDVNIIGNGPRALENITAVGNDLKIDNGTWVCGKEQNVPVSCGMPTVLVKSLIVGGE